MKTQMSVRCGKRIEVQDTPDGKGFILSAPCPANIPASTSTDDMLQKHCPACPFAAQFEATEKAKAAAATPPAAVPGPAPVPAAAPAVTMQDAVTLAAAPLPGAGQAEPDVLTSAAPLATPVAPAAPAVAPSMPAMPTAQSTIQLTSGVVIPAGAPIPAGVPTFTPAAAAAPPASVATPTGMPAPAPLPGQVMAATPPDPFVDPDASIVHMTPEQKARFDAEVANAQAQAQAQTQTAMPAPAALPQQAVPAHPALALISSSEPSYPNPMESVTPAMPGPAPFTPVVKSDFNTPIKIDGVSELDSEDYVDIEAALATVPGYVGGPSSGGLSSHMMADFASCPRKFYYSKVLGLVPDKPNRNFQFGTLFHACLAMRYLHGAEYTYAPCDAVAAAGAPKLAGEVKNLVMSQIETYQAQEWATWSVRGVESNIACWVPLKIGKKTVAVPIVGRVDIIVAKKGEHEPHPGPGPVPTGVYLGDWKTSSHATYDLIAGYGMDFQFLTYNAIFQLGNLEREYGPLRGTMITVAGKARGRKVPDADSFQRVETSYSRGALNEFIETELKPLAASLYTAITDLEVRENEGCWSRNHTQCIGRWGRCDFFDICDGKTVETAAGYHAVPGRKIDTSLFLAPPKDTVQNLNAADDAAATAKKQAATEQKDAVLRVVVTAFLTTLEQSGVINRAAYLVPGHTYEGVSKALCVAVKEAYVDAIKNKATFPLEDLTIKFLASGLSWVRADGAKGRITWKQLAEGICKLEWFDPAKALPPMA